MRVGLIITENKHYLYAKLLRVSSMCVCIFMYSHTVYLYILTFSKIDILYSMDRQYGLSNPIHLLFSEMKFNLNTNTLIHLCIVYGCLCATTAELNGCDREDTIIKTKIQIMCPFIETVCWPPSLLFQRPNMGLSIYPSK